MVLFVLAPCLSDPLHNILVYTTSSDVCCIARAEGDVDAASLTKQTKTDVAEKEVKEIAAAEIEVPRFKKEVLKKGDKVTFPKKGDTGKSNSLLCLFADRIVDTPDLMTVDRSLTYSY